MSLNALPPPTGATGTLLAFLVLVQRTVNEILKGRGNQVSTLTLAANVTTTTVTDNLFAADMVPVLIPTTANAATALATTYITTRTNGSFILTHANTATTDRTFLYIRGG